MHPGRPRQGRGRIEADQTLGALSIALESRIVMRGAIPVSIGNMHLTAYVVCAILFT